MCTPYFFFYVLGFCFFHFYLYFFHRNLKRFFLFPFNPLSVGYTQFRKQTRSCNARDIQKNAHILHGNWKLRKSTKVSFINYNTKLLQKSAPRVPHYVIILLLYIISKTPNRTYIILYLPQWDYCWNTSRAPPVYNMVGIL